MANLAGCIEESGGGDYKLILTGTETYPGALALTDPNSSSQGLVEKFLVSMQTNQTSPQMGLYLPFNVNASIYKANIQEAFVDCKNVKQSTPFYSFFGTAASEGYVNVGHAPFSSLEKLTVINHPVFGAYFCAFASILKEVSFEGATQLGDAAFRGCDGLTSLNLPESLTSVGLHFMMYCANIQEVYIPEAVGQSKVTDTTSLTALSKTDPSYSNGIILRGPGAQAMKAALPDRDDKSPFRKLILDPAWA